MAGYIVYFTRSGNSKRIAEALSKQTGYELVELTDGMDYHGVFGYIKAGYYATQNKPLDVKLSKEVPVDANIIVVSPLWAGGVAQPTRLFLRTRQPKNTSVLITSKGSVAKKLERRNDFYFVGDIVDRLNNETQILGAISKRIKE